MSRSLQGWQPSRRSGRKALSSSNFSLCTESEVYGMGPSCSRGGAPLAGGSRPPRAPPSWLQANGLHTVAGLGSPGQKQKQDSSDSVTPKRPGPARNGVSRDTQVWEHLAQHIPRCTSKGWCFGHGTGSCRQLLSDTSSAVLGETGRQGATASAAPTRQAPGPRLMLVRGRSSFRPALPHGHMLAPGRAAWLLTPQRGSQVLHSSLTSGAKGRPSVLGWVQRAALLGPLGRGRVPRAVLAAAGRAVGVRLCLTASKSTDRDKLHLPYSTSASRQLCWDRAARPPPRTSMGPALLDPADADAAPRQRLPLRSPEPMPAPAAPTPGSTPATAPSPAPALRAGTAPALHSRVLPGPGTPGSCVTALPGAPSPPAPHLKGPGSVRSRLAGNAHGTSGVVLSHRPDVTDLPARCGCRWNTVDGCRHCGRLSGLAGGTGSGRDCAGLSSVPCTGCQEAEALTSRLPRAGPQHPASSVPRTARQDPAQSQGSALLERPHCLSGHKQVSPPCCLPWLCPSPT